MIPFTHLHVHSDASLIDGLGRVERLVYGAKSKGFDALALTDHGSLANAVLFTIACKSAGIKPLLGIEGYFEVDGETGHLTVLANGQKGFKQLVQLNNEAHAGSGKKPSFTVDQLITHQDGLVVLTGCIASPLQQMPYRDAIKLGARLKAAFGHRMFAEVMMIADTDTWTRPLQLASELDIKPVMTNDAHFPFKEDVDVHPLLTSMKRGFTYNSKQLYLKTSDEMLAAGMERTDHRLVNEMMERAWRLGRLLESVDLERKPRLPNIADADEQLERRVIAASRSDQMERVRFELDVIKRMGYASYFIILADIIDHAKSIGVRVGPGRGSGAGSLVLYLLGVTDIDPIEHKLSFERFLNPEREGMPDVDVDFDSEGRDLVIDYAHRKWSAIPVATYARYSHKTLIHDLAKVLKMPRSQEEALAEGGIDSVEFRSACETVPKFDLAYRTILGQIRHRGKHAGGVIITDHVIPLERAGDQVVAAWTEGDSRELTYAGIVKFDLLGLSALAIIRRLEARFGMRATRPRDNDPVFSLFRDGNVHGIFQFSGSPGIIELTRKLVPTTFEDLVAINALYRPGALDVGSTDHYAEWKKRPRSVDPLLEPILRSTYGAIVYQEQVMSIFAAVTGGTLGQADLARRVIVKSKVGDPKWERDMLTLRNQFIDAATEKRMREPERLWNELASHARYSFNRSHAVAYSMIAWEMAWWKFHRPIDFYATLLNVDRDQAQTYIYDAVSHGVPVVPPNIETSTLEYEVKDGKIWMPLTAIKFLGEPGARAIIAARPFSSVVDLMARIPKSVLRARAREGLMQLNALPWPVTHRDLAIKLAPESRTLAATQQHYLGFVIPTPELIKQIEDAHASMKIAGIVSKIVDKRSRYGPYRVYYLLPEGIFWSRARLDVAVGDTVTVRIKSESGKATQVTKL